MAMNKQIGKYMQRRCVEYAAKQIASTRTYLRDSLFQAGMKSSVAYTAGNVVANFWGGLYAKADKVWMFFSGIVGFFFGI